MGEHWSENPLYSLAVLLFQLKTAILIVLFEQGKAAKLKSIVCGYRDALANRLGRRVVSPDTSEG